ncbi:hypothetical protein [Aureimonas sp. ME7]|uniref:hypothetical protein n=1 Tax=Aureimonas sp. ME7 TaxID=2744252 RepID=UPI0015F91B27|nr:hypothetical protein [Aureimonas sp. ME7]
MASDVSAAGAQAARTGERRSSNPHDVQTEEWNLWMDGFDQETVRIERKLGDSPIDGTTVQK